MQKQKTVILFHGFPKSIDPDTSPLYQYFSQKQYAVIMPDLFFNSFSVDRNAIKTYVKEEFRDKTIDAIVGVSMGGFIAPFVAERFPRAKLVFIGSGPYFQTNLPLYNFLVRVESRDRNLLLVRSVKKIPKMIYRKLYQRCHHHKCPYVSKMYECRADESWEAFRTIPLPKIRELLRFVVTTDNTALLASLSNDTLIFAGSRDGTMPLRLSKEMHALIPKSKLIISDRPHHDVFSAREYTYLDSFIA